MEAHDWQAIEDVFTAAIELPESERASFLGKACEGRPALLTEVESLMQAHRHSLAFLEPKPERVGPYRLLEKIGQGGMGEVYLGERADGQFEHRVAVKLLSPVGGPGLAHRFAEERQILADLSHPNIARLLDGGVTEFGVAYIVMELVEGIPVDRYCKDQPVAVRVRIFREICDAVQYAHQNLVVHRDLKPANILVTSEGGPKLLDFGIAKILKPGRELRTLLRPMTAAYASPEQTRGEPVTTASDIYSLGVVLRELLTGQPPDSPDRRASTGAQDLDAVIARATRPEARERYPSAEALGADLGRYLEHRPVEARRGAVWYVAQKFVARNRVATGVTCAAALAIAAGMGITVRQSRIAQRRFEVVRQLANSTVFQVHDAVAQLPGSAPVRKMIIANAIKALDRLATDATGDAVLQRDLAMAYKRLGDVQGRVSQDNLGDPEGALASYDKSLALVEDLLRRHPGDEDAVRGLIVVNRARSVVLGVLRRPKEARQAAALAVRLADEVWRRQPREDNEYLLASAYRELADVSDEADLTYRLKTLEIFERRFAAQPHDASRRRDLAQMHKHIAGILVPASYGEMALPHLERAENLDAERLREAPGSREAWLDLALDYSHKGNYYFNRQQYPQALESYRKSLVIRQRLSDSDSADQRLRLLLAALQTRIAQTLELMKRHGEALATFQTSLRLSQEMAAVDPTQPQYRNNIAAAHLGVAINARKLGKRVEACSAWRAALGVYGDLQAKGWLREEERVRIDESARRFEGCPH